SRPLRIVIVTRDVRVVGPTLRRKNACRGVRKPVHQVLDKWLTIYRIGDRLAYSNVPEYGITQIEREISQLSSRGTLHLQRLLFFERQHSVEIQCVAGHIGTALAEFEGACGRIGHHRKTQPRNVSLGSPVIGIAFEDYFFILLRADKAERA